MKTLSTLLVGLFVAVACHAQPGSMPRPMPRPPLNLPGQPPSAPAAKAADLVNYLIRVEWNENDAKKDTKSLEVLTAEGNFEFDGLQKNSVKINDNDVPITLKFSGTLTTLSEEKGRLQLFLGRTVPYITGSYGSGPGHSSSYSQMSVGLQSAIIVKFGKPAVIKRDENGTITVLVKRMED